MKTLIILLLAFISPVTIADPSATEQWRDSSSSNSFSDERYQRQYTPEQRQAFIDQRNTEIAKRNHAELEKQQAHYQEMQQYYATHSASQEFLDEVSSQNPPTLQQPPQYYPNYNYYGGNGRVQLGYTAFNARAAEEQYEADYERWRQDQNSRRETERFVSPINDTSSSCQIKTVMSDEDRSRCQ
jgi:hypothetical protein